MVNQEKITNSSKRTNFRWVVAFLFFLVYVVAAADRANFGVAMPFIREEFHISNTEAGALISLFLLFYGLFQLPGAWLISKFGTRKVIPLAMISTSLVTACIGLSHGLLQLKFCRALLGIAEAPLPVGITSTINCWFPSKEKGTASGLYLAAAKFGPVLVPPLCVAIAAIWGWREIFIFFAVPGIILSVFWLIFIPATPKESKFVNAKELDYIEEKEEKTTDNNVQHTTSGWVKPMPVTDKIIRAKNTQPLESTAQVIRSWNIIGSGIGYAFQVGITNTIMAWLPTYLLVVKQFSLVDMGIIASAPWIGAVIGNLLGGVLSDKLLKGRRKPGMMISALTTTVMMALIVLIPGGALYYGFMFFITGVLLCVGYSNYMSYPMGVVTKDKFPLAVAIVNMCGQFGGAAAPLVVGIILDTYGWNMSFVFLGIISLLTFFILFSMTEPLKLETAKAQ